MLPILQNLSMPARTPVTPRPSTPVKPKAAFTFTSPMPLHVDLLRKCLTHFERAHHIPVQNACEVLSGRAITPDLVPRMPLARLCELTDMLEGHAMRLQEFCSEWVQAFEERRGL